MPNPATFTELLKFLDYLSDKGLLKQQTAASRKAVVNKVFETLDDEDRANVLALDLDDVMNRFINKVGNKYSPGSLQTYKSRLNSTLDDFQAYKENPMGFRPSVVSRSSRRNKSATTEDPVTAQSNSLAPAIHQSTTMARPTMPSADILPIPLRDGLVVRIQGLPHDLTLSEAKKIATVVQAFVADE